MKNSKGMITCRYLQLEIQTIKEILNFKIPIIQSPCSCLAFPTGGKGFRQTSKNLCLCCHTKRSDDLFELHQSVESVINHELICQFQTEGAYVILPAWLDSWQQSLESAGFDHSLAQSFFQESCKKIILLDTGLRDNSKNKLKELGEFINIETQIFPVGLSFLQQKIELFIAQSRLRRYKRRTARISQMELRRFSDAQMTVSFTQELAQATSVEEVYNILFRLTELMVGPGLLLLMDLQNPKLPKIERGCLPESESLDNLANLAKEMGNKPISHSQGLFVPMYIKDRLISCLILRDLACPQNEKEYLNILTQITPLAVMAIEHSILVDASIITERIRAVNAMIGTYNHEINNPLAIAMARLEYYVRKGSREDLFLCRSALDRVAKIVHQIGDLVGQDVKFEEYFQGSATEIIKLE